jgi:hypothetical protein
MGLQPHEKVQQGQEFTAISEKSIATEQYRSNFDGEVMAIWQALKELNKQQLVWKNLVLIIYSIAVISIVDKMKTPKKRKLS